MATMGAEVDIQTQVHELGGAVSELSLGDTVRRIRILLDRLQLEAGAGKTFRQEMDPLLDHVAALKLIERDGGDYDREEEEDVTLPIPAPPSGPSLNHQAAAEVDDGCNMADNSDEQSILPPLNPLLPNHALTQNVFEFSAMDMDVQSKTTQGGHRKQLNHRYNRKISTSPGKEMGTATELRTPPPPPHPIVNSSHEVFEFKSSTTQGLSQSTPRRSRRAHRMSDSHRDSPTQERDATSTTSPAADLGDSILRPEPEQPLSSEKDVTMSSMMEMEDATDPPPSAASAAPPHSSCAVSVNEGSQNPFVFGISPLKQPQPPSSTTTLPFTFSLPSSPSPMAPPAPPANDGCSANSSSGTLSFTANPKPIYQPTFYFGAGASATVVLDATTLPVVQPPAENGACSFHSWEEEAEAIKQMQVNPFSPLTTSPGGIGDGGNSNTKMKRDVTGTIRAHSNLRSQRRSRQQPKNSTTVHSDTTAPTEAETSNITAPHVEENGDLDLHMDPSPDKLLRTWEEQLREEAEMKMAEEHVEDRMRVLHVRIEEAMRASLTLKTVAARHYINGNYSLAAKQYTEALHVLYDVDPQQEEQDSLLSQKLRVLLSRHQESISSLLWNRAAAWIMLGMFGAAVEDCTISLEMEKKLGNLSDDSSLLLDEIDQSPPLLSSGCLRSILRLARVKLKQGQFDKAEQLFRRAGGSGMEGVRSVIDLKTVAAKVSHHLSVGTPQDALRASEQVLVSSPASTATLKAKGEALMALKRHHEAAHFCEEAARILALSSFTATSRDILDHPVVSGTASLSFLAGSLPQSLQDCLVDSLRYSGRPSEANSILSAALERGGEESIWASSALRRDEELKLLKSRADSSYERGDFAGAVATYATALRVDPDFDEMNAIILCNRAAALMALNRHASAVADCTAALQKRPTYSKARLRRARALCASGQWSSALADYSAWLERSEEANSSDEVSHAEVRKERSFVSRKLAEEREKERQRKKKSAWGSYYTGGGDSTSWSDDKHSEFFGYKDYHHTGGGVHSDNQRQEEEDDWDNDPYDFYRSSNFYRFGFGGRGGGTPNRRGNNGGERRRGSTGSTYKPKQQNSQDSSNSMGDTHVEMCHYSILGIERSATQADIKRAYRGLALQFHPDKNPTEAAGVKFRNISAAYEVIGDAASRRKYDNQLLWA